MAFAFEVIDTIRREVELFDGRWAVQGTQMIEEAVDRESQLATAIDPLDRLCGRTNKASNNGIARESLLETTAVPIDELPHPILCHG